MEGRFRNKIECPCFFARQTAHFKSILRQHKKKQNWQIAPPLKLHEPIKYVLVPFFGVKNNNNIRHYVDLCAV